MGRIVKNTIIITAITVIAGLLLGIVYQVTKAPIALAEQSARERAYAQVLPDADSFEDDTAFDAEEAQAFMDETGFADVIDNVVVATKSGEPAGYVITVTSKEGFGGDIQFTVGIDQDGVTKGVSILSISETAGLGMKATEPAFLEQFRDRDVTAFMYTKEGADEDNEIDALSGATITTNAMTNGVNAALAYYDEALKEGGSGNE